MPEPKGFVAQVAGLPTILEALSYHRAVPMDVLAREVGLPERKTREVLVTYFMTDETEANRGWLPPLSFLDESGEDADPLTAPLVRLTSDIATNDLAFRYSPVDTWARTYRKARNQLHLEPENSLLEAALDKLQDAIDDEMRPSSRISHRPDGPAAWYRAAREGHRVRIVYARAWRPGLTERVVDPYRVVRTRRGWEVDAGPPDENSRLRTYLLSGVVSADVLDETFDPPDNLVDLLVEQRRTTPVTFVLAPDQVWVVERLAERIEEIRRDDEAVEIRAYLLEPVRDRAAAALAMAGPDAMVVGKELMDAGRDLARVLLEHHRL